MNECVAVSAIRHHQLSQNTNQNVTNSASLILCLRSTNSQFTICDQFAWFYHAINQVPHNYESTRVK